MKKLIALILCAAVICMLTLSASAAASYSKTEPTNLGTLIVKKGAAQEDVAEFGGTVVNLKAGGTTFCPKVDQWVRYEFKADKDGTYTFVFEYVARTGSNRAVDYAIDSKDAAKRVFCDLPESDDHQFAIVTEELTAGTHSFYFFMPTGFDDTNIKSCDIYGWAAYFTKEKEAPKPAETKTETKTAAKTADGASVALAALAVSAAAAIVVSKKH